MLNNMAGISNVHKKNVILYMIYEQRYANHLVQVYSDKYFALCIPCINVYKVM